MAKYAYQAKNKTGQLSQGEIDGLNETEVRIKLRAMGLEASRVISKSQIGAAAARKAAPSGGMNLFRPRVKGKDLQVFTRQFATLINAGIPVVDALKILSEGMRPGPLKDAASKVKSSIENGRRLAEAMSQHPYVFDRLYCNMIQAGEEAGIMDGILARLAQYIEKSEKIRGQVKGAMVYPGVIIAVACMVITGILVFIMPKFEQFFAAAGKAPPALTQMVVNISHSMVNQWYVYLGVLIGVPVLFMQWAATPSGKESLDRFLIYAPIFGDVIQKSALARLTRTLSTLLSSGVGVIEAIEIAAKTAGNSVVESALLRARNGVMQGRPFAGPLTKEKVIPDMVVQMIAIGEQSGTMDIMLGKIADFYEDEVENAVKAMTSLIEPLLMVVLGGAIAFLVIAMYLPVFNMADAVGGG
jgi:type IV pilus assembly protein PilC